MTRRARVLLIGLVAAQGVGAQQVHKLPATPQTVVYGYYWSEAKPALRIKSGDIIDVETMLTSTPQRLEQAGVPPADVQQSLRDIVSQVTDRGPGGHILTGPVYVEGAEPGDVLEVKVLSIGLPIAYGYNACQGFMRELCERPTTSIIPMDRQKMTADFLGITIPLAPFFGSMGVAPPPARGRVSSAPPDIHAGNLDNKELVAGTTLYIPIHVPGALFEVGDGHAAQGDGEVDITAIETSLTGRLQLTVRKDMKLEWPLGETRTHWITMGMDKDLTVATRICVQNTVKFLMERVRLTQTEAYQLTSLAVDLRITQLVDGNVGVHAMIDKKLLRRK
jgi:acetamidase/formamidase